MKNEINKEVSKKLNKIVIFASLTYTLVFIFIYIYILNLVPALLDNKHQNLEILSNSIRSFPLVFILFYLISGLQILFIGYLLKFFYKNNLVQLLDTIRLKDYRSIILVLFFSIIWLILNVQLYNYLGGALKFG